MVNRAEEAWQQSRAAQLRVGTEKSIAIIADYGEERYREGVEAAAKLVDSWDISRGGYTELAHNIRLLEGAPK